MTDTLKTPAPTKTRKTPVPQGYERILAGALKLSLKERKDIANALKASVDNEVSTLQLAAKTAAEIANGTSA